MIPRPSAAKATALVLSICLLALSPSVRAERILLEAEAFTAYHEIGFNPIINYGAYLFGLDYPGEWVEYLIANVSTLGTRSVTIKAIGEAGVPYHLRVTATPDNPANSQSVDVTFTGKGLSG